MEAQAGSGGGGGGGEVRKVHIVYFLSHKGRIEQPHLIRVHHLSRNGVRLRDIKRWLSELRGKDMPESFAWSYKRKFKAGYVWQDLLDEDLITPISDNEYVLKGSEIPSINFTNEFGSYVEKEVSNPKTSPPFEADIKEPKKPLTNESQENSTNSSSKTSFEIEELPSFGSETSTDDTPKKQEDYKFFDTQKRKEEQSQKEAEVNSILETFLNKNKSDNKIKKDRNSNQKDINGSNKSSPSSNYSFEKSSSYSSLGAAHMFLNLLTCGIVDTNESVVTVRRKSNVETSTGQVVKGDKVGGSERVSRTHWTTLEQQRDNRKEGPKTSYNISESNNDVKTVQSAYKFVSGPYCSQCRRRFNPEKLHAHMKSCRRMKALVKAAKCKS